MPLVSEKLVELIRLKNSESRTDKNSFLIELGLEENIHDGDEPWEDCIEGEYELEEVRSVLVLYFHLFMLFWF